MGVRRAPVNNNTGDMNMSAELREAFETLSENALDQRARRAARRAGLLARKSRWRANSIENHGGFALIDPNTNFIVRGSRFELSADYIIDYCSRQD
jgi:hypothetical protein